MPKFRADQFKPAKIDHGSGWAMELNALETFCAEIESRNQTYLASMLGMDADKRGMYEIRDGVAILPINGPLFSSENIWTFFGMATSYDSIIASLQLAEEDPEVDSILLEINSPGGEVDGTSEVASIIKRSSKDVFSYVRGAGASAAYWIGSSASKVFLADTAQVGSIGVYASTYDFKKALENAGIKKHEFISSQSPNKRLDLNTAEGKEAIQSKIDYLADIFIAAVASNRGVRTQTVIDNFGKGDVVIGKDAVSRGMADEVVATFEDVLNQIKKKEKYAMNNPGAVEQQKLPATFADMKPEDLKVSAPALYDAVMTLGSEREFARGKEIRECLKGFSDVDIKAANIEGMLSDFKSTGRDVTFAVVQAQRERVKALTTAAAADGALIPVITSGNGEEIDRAAEIKSAAELIAGGF